MQVQGHTCSNATRNYKYGSQTHAVNNFIYLLMLLQISETRKCLITKLTIICSSMICSGATALASFTATVFMVMMVVVMMMSTFVVFVVVIDIRFGVRFICCLCGMFCIDTCGGGSSGCRFINARVWRGDAPVIAVRDRRRKTA